MVSACALHYSFRRDIDRFFLFPLRHRNKSTATEEEDDLPDEVADLGRRLDLIMSKLHGLQAQVGKLKAGQQQAPSSLYRNQIEKVTLVIEADPNYPPLSLLPLIRSLASQVRMSISTHGHSSLSDPLPVHLVSWPGSVMMAPERSRIENQLNLTWIWKPVGSLPTAKIVDVSSGDLQGQASIARLLARLMESWTKSSFYEDFGSSTAAQIDEWIDQLERGPGSGLSLPPGLLKRIEARLSSADWLAGPGRGERSLADVFLSSLVGNQLTSDRAKDWCKRCVM